jgi:flagellar motor switch protein FliM
MTAAAPASAPRPGDRRRDIRDLLLDASHFSIDQMPMLPVIFNRLASQLAERLRALGPGLPMVTVNAVESMRIGDALDAYDLRAVAGIFHVPAWDNRVIVGFDRDFVFTLVEVLFGSDGSERPFDEVRALTSLEVSVAQHLFEQIAVAMQGAFSLVADARFRFERCETRMDFAAAGRRSHPGVVARFILQALGRGGEMFVIIPQAGLTMFRQALSRTLPAEAHAMDPAWAKQIGAEVGRTEIGVTAIIETSDYTLGDLAELRVGQVLKLPATLKSRVKVESSEQPLFWAYLGQSDGRHTLCIDEPIDQEREFLTDVLGR